MAEMKATAGRAFVRFNLLPLALGFDLRAMGRAKRFVAHLAYALLAPDAALGSHYPRSRSSHMMRTFAMR